LCVVRKVLETHQGRLSIFNPSPGQVSSIRLSLPLGVESAVPSAN